MNTRPPSYGPPYALADLEVLVVGYGRSGQAAARLCLREGAKVTATDRRDLKAIVPAVQAIEVGATPRLVLGGHKAEDFVGADLIVLSPGVPPDLAELEAARAAGVPILGELEVAVSFLTELPLVAVTGTNGKSTTTALIGELLSAAGKKVFTGGNLGRPASEAALAPASFEVIVLEVSSFQLETVRHLRPRVALLLNLSSDHLDRHGDLAGYAAAKARLFQNAGEGDVLVVNADDPQVLAMVEQAGGSICSFGREARGPGGAFLAEGRVVYHAPDGALERYRLDGAALRGHHNAMNAAAAVIAARTLGATPPAVERGLARFAGLPHRLESLGAHQGVEWVNDSKATNVESAVTGVSAFPTGIVLIAGGRGKGASYAPLAEVGRGRLKAVLGIGEDGPAIVDALRPVSAGPAEVVASLEAAVIRARELSSEGDVVLLSPACASYDHFENYVVRGETFRKLVEALP